jgi:hypothetical protein
MVQTMATDYLVLLHSPRKCKRCGEWSLWSLESQLWTDKGICLDHARDIYERDGEQDYGTALRAVVRALGPVDVIEEQPQSLADRSATVTLKWVCSGAVQRFLGHLGSDFVGRCAGCGTAIRRYGPQGRPLCDTCASPAT